MSEETTPVATNVPDFQELGTPEQIAELYGALALAKLEFGKIAKNRTVSIASSKGAYKFDYADLEASLDATTAALSKQGLVVIQPPSVSGILRTILAHKSGARIVCVMSIPEAGDIKSYGGNITYMRRYAYNALLCLSADQDADDMPEPKRGEQSAEAAPRRQPEVPAQAAPKPQAPQGRPEGLKPRNSNELSDEQRANLRRLTGLAGFSDNKEISDFAQAKLLTRQVDRTNYDRFVEALEKCIEDQMPGGL